MTRNSWVRWPTIALLALAVVAGACGDDDDDDDDAGSGSPPAAGDLADSTFTSDDVEGWTLVEGTEIQLAFTAESVGATAGCNTMTGSWTISESTLEVGTMASTLMACEDDLQAQDLWLAGFLEGGPTVALDGDVLTLTSADATITATRQA
jgi:heat shock protein HslJ